LNGSPIGGAAGGDPPLGQVAAGGLWRVALAGLVLVLATVIVTMSGGAGLGGRLGALFGLHSNAGAKPASAIHAGARAPVKARPTVARGRLRHPARSAPGVRLRSRQPAATGPQRTPAPSPRPVSPSRPAPSPSPSPSPVPVPPKPAPSGNVQHVVRTLRDTTAPVVPAPAQPVLEQTASAVDQVCGRVGGCP
jgi:hypothetical protein